MLVGREDEKRRIRNLLAGARRGTSGVLVLQGEAGIGKTALLDHARVQATGMTVLRMTGVEDEAELAFAGLTELLGPVIGAVDRLPPPQAGALRSALALQGGPSNPLALRVALLTLLATLAEDAPVLVAVDDAQWLDESSLTALAFAARRLTAERVAVVIAARDAWPVALGLPPEAHVWLAGLADDEARQLLAERPNVVGAPADDLVRLAAGNPLALLELPAAIDPTDGWDGVRPPPVGPRVDAAFRARLDRLDGTARLALGVVAADSAAALGDILRAFATLDLTPGALQPAEREGLVLLDGDQAGFRHPLLRSAAYHALAPPDRRRVHAALADALDRPAGVERRTWHRAAAAVGPDEDVARALEAVAARAEQRGALTTAADGLARAAGLSAGDDARARRLRASADAWLAAGHWDVALARLDEAAAHAADPAVPGLLAPIADLAEGLIGSDLADAEHVFSLVVLAGMALETWDRAEALLDVMVRRAHDTGRHFLLALALAAWGEIACRRGRWTEAYTLVTNDVWATPIDVPGIGAGLRAVQARVEAALGLADEAEAHGQAALASAEATGTHAVAAWAGASLGFLELGRRRPEAAVAHLERVAAILEGGGVAEPGILWWAADLVEAHWLAGDLAAARRRLEALVAQAEATDRVWARAVAARCTGLLAATPAGTEAAFAEALWWHDELDAPPRSSAAARCCAWPSAAGRTTLPMRTERRARRSRRSSASVPSPGPPRPATCSVTTSTSPRSRRG